MLSSCYTLLYMTKRKLTQNQQRRIHSLQDRRRKELHCSDDVESNSLENAQEGLLITRYGKQAIVEDKLGNTIVCHFRQNLSDIVAGDKVIWMPNNKSGVITAILPRTSTLFRQDFLGNQKPLAANATSLVIVIAPSPPATHETVDSYLIMAEKLKLNPILVLNKADLIKENQVTIWQHFLKIYQDIGYSVFMTSMKDNQGMADLQTILAHQTSILVGQSGVGKSSLINRLIPHLEIKIGDLSEKCLGKHTTSIAALYHIPTGGQLIDSPGVRRFKLQENQPDLLIEGYVEMRQLAGACRFRNCHHLIEPNCAIIHAVTQGKVSQERYDSFKKLYQTLIQH